MRAILVIDGPHGSGKTTLSGLLAEELAPASTLLIDTCPQQALTLQQSPNPTPLTVAHLLHSQQEVTSGTKEAIDWGFHDVLVPLGEEIELLTLGALSAPLSPADQDKLHYGLSRLIANYDYVVLDGTHPALWAALPLEHVLLLYVLTPTCFPHWTPPLDLTRSGSTPCLILNQYGQEPLPPALADALQQGDIQLIGKIPRYETRKELVDRLSDDMQGGLFRLNIPFGPHASGGTL